MQLAAIATPVATPTPPLKAHTPFGTIMAEDYPDDVFMFDVKLGGRYEGATAYASVRDAVDGAKALTAAGGAPAAVVVRTSAGAELRTGWMRSVGKDGYRWDKPGAWERLDLQDMGHYFKYFADDQYARDLGIVAVIDGRSAAWVRKAG